MPRVWRLIAAGTVLLLLAGGGQALGRTANAPRLHRALRARQIRRIARANRVIVILDRQQRGRLATAAGVRARTRVQARERRGLFARVARAGGRVTHKYRS